MGHSGAAEAAKIKASLSQDRKARIPAEAL
jgi:hypothetical protein